MKRLSRLKAVALAMLALVTVGASPAHAEWLRAESQHFIVYGDTSEAALRRYVQKVERFDSLLRTYYPRQLDHEIPKLEIFMAAGLDDLRRASPGLSSGVGGFYSPNSGRIFAVVDTDSEMGDAVLFHEYGHHFMFQMMPASYPAWFVEGFAEYYATADVRPGKLEIGSYNPGRMNSLTEPANSWPTLSDVLSWRIAASGRYRGADYYAFAWALTHYMLSDPARTQQLGRYLAAVVDGGDPVTAMQDATGRTAPQLQDDLRRYMMGRINAYSPQITLPDAEVQITRLPDVAARLIWMDLRLDRHAPGEDDDDEEPTTDRQREARTKYREARAALIRDALDAGPRYPGDRTALMVKARAERLSANPGAALATLQPLIGEGSSDAGALRIAGLASIDLAKQQGEATARTPLLRQAQAYLSRALDADPLDFRTYLALDSVRQGQPGYPSANDAVTLEIATQLAPQSFDGRMRYATVLMARNQPLDAIRMLAPVANSPHGGSSRVRARAMLETARRQAGLAPAADADAPPPEDDPA